MVFEGPVTIPAQKDQGDIHAVQDIKLSIVLP